MTQKKASKLSSRNASLNGMIGDKKMRADTELEVAEKTRLRNKTAGKAGQCPARNGQAGRWRSIANTHIKFVVFVLVVALGAGSFGVFAQKRTKQRPQNNAPLTSHSRDSLAPEAREMVEQASVIVCKE